MPPKGWKKRNQKKETKKMPDEQPVASTEVAAEPAPLVDPGTPAIGEVVHYRSDQFPCSAAIVVHRNIDGSASLSVFAHDGFGNSHQVYVKEGNAVGQWHAVHEGDPPAKEEPAVA